MAVYPLRKSRNASAVFCKGAGMAAPKSNYITYGKPLHCRVAQRPTLN
jgi:hypothetical protein